MFPVYIQSLWHGQGSRQKFLAQFCVTEKVRGIVVGHFKVRGVVEGPSKSVGMVVTHYQRIGKRVFPPLPQMTSGLKTLKNCCCIVQLRSQLEFQYIGKSWRCQGSRQKFLAQFWLKAKVRGMLRAWKTYTARFKVVEKVLARRYEEFVYKNRLQHFEKYRPQKLKLKISQLVERMSE